LPDFLGKKTRIAMENDKLTIFLRFNPIN